MTDWLQTIFGKVTLDEALFVCLVFGCVVIYSRVSRVGEAIGRLFEGRRGDE